MNNEVATFAGGCFWCFEAIFRRLKGVKEVISGYGGGSIENPTYEQIHYLKTGHAEAVEVTFDPSIISYEKLLDVFWHFHDPTTLNRQGNDVGLEYRSIILYHNEKQKKSAEESKIKAQSMHPYPIVTTIEPFVSFYPAEPHHQKYYDRNTDAPYCRYIIDPKLQKLLKKYGKDVKEEYKK